MRILLIGSDEAWWTEASTMLLELGVDPVHGGIPAEHTPNVDLLASVEIILVQLPVASSIPSWIPVTASSHMPILLCCREAGPRSESLTGSSMEVFSWPPSQTELRLRLAHARDVRRAAELEQELRDRSIELERHTQDVFEAWAEVSFAHEEATVAHEELKERDADKTHLI